MIDQEKVKKPMGRPKGSTNKVKPETPLIEETPFLPEDESGVKVTFEKADDYEAPKKSFMGELKKGVSSFLHNDYEEERKPKPENKRQRTFQRKSKVAAKGFIWTLSRTFPELNEKFMLQKGEEEIIISLLPSDEQAENIVKPILRIMDRHIKVADVHPDIADLISAGTSLVEYAWVTRGNLLLLRQIKEMEMQTHAKNNHQSPYQSNIESRGPEINIPADQTESSIA